MNLGPELRAIEVLHCGNNDFRLFFLWPWPWPNDLYKQSSLLFPGDTSDVQIWTSYTKGFKSYLLTDIHTDRQTRPKLYITPLRRSITVTNCGQITVDNETSRSAIAVKPRCGMCKLCQKYKCEKRASEIALSYGVNVNKWSFNCFTSLCLYLPVMQLCNI